MKSPRLAEDNKIAPELAALAKMAATVAAFCVAAIGAFALIGWFFDIDALKTLIPATATTKANTAVCLLLCAGAVWSASHDEEAPQFRKARTWAVGIVTAIVGLTLFEHLLHANFGIDQLIARDLRSTSPSPGRMSIPTVTAFLLFGLAMHARLHDDVFARWRFLFATIAGLTVSFLVLIGYAYDLPLLYAPTPTSASGFNTAVAFLLLFIGVSALRPDIGWFAFLDSTSITGVFARWLFPAIVIVPALLGWIIYRLYQDETLNAQESFALFALGSMIGLSAITWGVGLVATKLDERVKMQRQVLTAITNSALDAFIQMNQRGEVFYWNPRAVELFGWSEKEALGQPIKNLILNPEMASRYDQTLKEYLAINDINIMRRRREIVVRDKTGKEFPAEFATYPVLFTNGWVISMYVKDLSPLRQAEAQLRQAQKMEAVGQLTGGIAHDFNNLLTVIIVTLDSLVARVSADLRPRMENALSAAERGSALTKQLLAYARRQALAPDRIDLNAVVAALRDIMQSTLGSAIELKFKLSETPCMAFADRTQVESALLNLAINARDAMTEGGSLVIETGNAELDEVYAARNADVRPGRYAMLAVSDTGRGMTPEIQERAFEPFFTTKEFGKGSGLGLSMIYGFTKQSQGHVKIYSEIGHGTTVRLYLPAGEEHDARLSVKHIDVAAHEARGETILVVEDDPHVRATALSQLQELGYKTIEAANGVEALKLLENGCEIDLLFTDVMMPGGVSGKQLAIRAGEMRPGLKTLYTSGYTDNSIIHDGRLDADVHFIAKPYRKGDLAVKLRQAIET